VSELYDAPVVPMRYHPRRVLVLAAAIAVAGILAAAAYAGYALTHGATPVPTIGCYETDSLDANTTVLTSGIHSPVAACTRIYASAFPDAQPPARFAACVLSSGSIAVFPNDSGDVCKSLGLARG